MFRKIYTVLKQEGLMGLLARVRFQKKPRFTENLTPHFPLPIRLQSKDVEFGQLLSNSIQAATGRGSVCSSDAQSTLHISPSDRKLPYGPEDAVIFKTAEEGLKLANDPDCLRLLKNCAAVLLPSIDVFEAFEILGIPRGRLFVMSSLSTRGNINVRELSGDLSRWLIAAGSMDAEAVKAEFFPGLHALFPGDRICLSLPETSLRRRSFEAQKLPGFKVFDGIRQASGWQGCGWSYATIARAALEQHAFPIIVCEDDISPNQSFERNLLEIEKYLSMSEWDVFSGLLSNIQPDCKIHHVEKRGELTFVHLDFTVGMVCNIYNETALRRLANWKPEPEDIRKNAIDVWLGNKPNLRVITTIPFIASHSSDETSTIFGFSNRRYDTVIQASERRLAELVANR